MAMRNDAAVPAVVLLLACDAQQSVLAAIRATQRDAAVYSPYGHRNAPSSAGLSGFNGGLPEPATGHYLLGHGYRTYNPTLRRFNQPDNWSPFGAGGLNTYAYCAGDPVNRRDPTGHMSWGGASGADGSTPPSERESGGASIWSAIAFGLAAIVVVGGVGAAAMKLKTRWMNRVQKDSGVSTPPRPPRVPKQRPPVAQVAPLRAPPAPPSPLPGPSRAAPPSPLPGPSQAAPPGPLPSPSSEPPRLRRPSLRQALADRNGEKFVEIAQLYGNVKHARTLLHEQLPLRDEFRKGTRPRGLTPQDLRVLNWQFRNDPAFVQFLAHVSRLIPKS